MHKALGCRKVLKIQSCRFRGLCNAMFRCGMEMGAFNCLQLDRSNANAWIVLARENEPSICPLRITVVPVKCTIHVRIRKDDHGAMVQQDLQLRAAVQHMHGLSCCFGSIFELIFWKKQQQSLLVRCTNTNWTTIAHCIRACQFCAFFVTSWPTTDSAVQCIRCSAVDSETGERTDCPPRCSSSSVHDHLRHRSKIRL